VIKMSLNYESKTEMLHLTERIKTCVIGGDLDLHALEEVLSPLFARLELLQEWNAKPPHPIPLLLKCPECGARPVDIHTSHSCQFCGWTWRPAVVATVGVQFLPGFKDEE